MGNKRGSFPFNKREIKQLCSYCSETLAPIHVWKIAT